MRPNARFQTTRWSIVEAYQQSTDEDERRRWLDELANIYREPVYGHFRRSGCSLEQADDLTQAFFSDVILQRTLFQKADPHRARLRSLLFTALRNFRIDAHRSDASQVTTVTLPHPDGLINEDAPPLEFDRAFVAAVLQEAIRCCEGQLVAAGRQRQWDAFARFVLRPATTGTSRPTLKTLAAELGFVSVAAAGSAIHATRLQVRDMLETTIRRTVGPGSAEAELRYLLSLVGITGKPGDSAD